MFRSNDLYNFIRMATGFNTSFGMASNQFNNSVTGDKKNASDYKKIFCAYHSSEFLTNFCTDRECLMPLCPTCVVEHTEQHYQNQQKPAYVNLHEALQDSKQKCYTNIMRLQEYSHKNGELSNYIQGLPDYIRKQLAECKEKINQFIDQQFDSYQNILIDKIRGKYAEDGVYNRKECEQVRDFISSEIQALYDKITQLKGQQCLAALIRYYQIDEINLDAQMKEIGQYIQKNKHAGGLYISLQMEQLAKDMEGICERVVKSEYIQQDADKSMSSTRNMEYQQMGKKGVMSSSVVNRIGGSNVKESKMPPMGSKEKLNVKGLSSSLSYSSQKQRQREIDNKNYYNSPFKNAQNF